MPRKNHRSGDNRGGHRQPPLDQRAEPPAPRHARTVDHREPTPRAVRVASSPYNVILSAHAARQLDELGSPAERALQYLRQAGREELEWSAQPMPAQPGRDVWLLGAGTVRVLLDVEGDDLTIQGFGLQPGRRSLLW